MNLAAITSKYVGQPFSKYNCLGILHAIYADLGVDLPIEYGGYTLDNYYQFFQADPQTAQALMAEMIQTLGQEVSINQKRLGDLLIISQDGDYFPAMYMGGSTAIASFYKDGVMVFPLNRHMQPVIARRIL